MPIHFWVLLWCRKLVAFPLANVQHNCLIPFYISAFYLVFFFFFQEQSMEKARILDSGFAERMLV